MEIVISQHLAATMPNTQAIVIFSGGQDSTTCLLKAIAQYGREHVQAITFYYGQRHQIELDCAKWIAEDLNIQQTLLDLSLIKTITHNALMDEKTAIAIGEKNIPNTFVDGRNALFLLYAAIYAKSQAAKNLIIGVSETDFSGYPDCRHAFIQSMNHSLNLAMDYPFQIHAPLMFLSKAQTWALADQLGYLDYVQTHSHSCYQGIKGGCGQCPSCQLRQQGLNQYLANKSAFTA